MTTIVIIKAGVPLVLSVAQPMIKNTSIVLRSEVVINCHVTYYTTTHHKGKR